MSPQTSQTSSAITNTVARKAAESGAEEEGQAGAVGVGFLRRPIRRSASAPSDERTPGGFVELRIVHSDPIRGHPEAAEAP